MTDATGGVLRYHDYLPFGEEWPTQPTHPDQRLFTGKERDFETSLDYFGARYYRPDLGRFTTSDRYVNERAALPDPQRWHRLAYSLNNPVRLTDPDGRETPVVLSDGRMVGMGTEMAPPDRTANPNVVLLEFGGVVLGGGLALEGVAAVGTALLRFAPLLTPAGAALTRSRDVAVGVIQDVRGLATSPVTASRITSVLNSFRDHATDQDLRGVLRETAGLLKGDHAGELRTVVNSALNLKSSLQGAIQNPQLQAQTRAVYVQAVEAIDRFVQTALPLINQATQRK